MWCQTITLGILGWIVTVVETSGQPMALVNGPSALRLLIKTLRGNEKAVTGQSVGRSTIRCPGSATVSGWTVQAADRRDGKWQMEMATIALAKRYFCRLLHRTL